MIEKKEGIEKKYKNQYFNLLRDEVRGMPKQEV